MNLTSIFSGRESIDSVIKKGESLLKTAGIFNSTPEQQQSVAILKTSQDDVKKAETLFGETAPQYIQQQVMLRNELQTRLRPKVDSLFRGVKTIEQKLFMPGTEIVKPILEKTFGSIPESRTVKSGLFGDLPVKQSLLSTVPIVALATDLLGPGGKGKETKKIVEETPKSF